jgi:phosphoglycerate dehydrogenase-like enzyme
MAADPSIPRLVVSDFQFRAEDRERIAAAVDGKAVFVRGRDALSEALKTHPETDVLCTFFPPANLYELVPHLRWLALASAGADHVLRAGLVREAPPVVTTANGVHAVPISEFVFSAMLVWSRHWPRILDLQREHAWPDSAGREALHGSELFDATLGIIGLGAIGRRVAQFGRGFGMHVLAVRRSVAANESDPDVDELLPAARLGDLLERADYVVVSVPSTPESHHLIGEEQLKRMKPSALLVNIARGEIIDEQALVRALQQGTIAGAALDVVETEPLPQASPLWTLPNVLLSPHISGITPRYSQRLTDLFLDNLARYREGRPLRNVVDPARGY